jgi:hypothetical protein
VLSNDVNATEETIFEDLGTAECVALAVDAGIGLRASRDGVILRDPLEGIGVHDPVTRTRFDESAPISCAIDAAQTVLRFGRVAFGRDCLGGAIVNGIDHAPIACEP